MSGERLELCLRAPAKINLWLRVHGQRADGYRELSTVMLALELSDRLRGACTSGPEIELEVHGPAATADIPGDERNLVWRALQAVRELASQRGRRDLPGLRVSLEKQIPSQAGLGGGSSDAAAALLLGERLLDLDGGDLWRRATLAELGADCNFFHEVQHSPVALCRGVGERVQPWPMDPPAWTVALIVPGVLCPTGLVFEALESVCESASDVDFSPSDLTLGLPQLRSKLATDLESAALRAVPPLQAWRTLLDSRAASHFRLSGSGSVFFGLFEDERTAAEKLLEIEQAADSQGLPSRASFLTRARPAQQMWERAWES